jgi:hypothetical protein
MRCLRKEDLSGYLAPIPGEESSALLLSTLRLLFHATNVLQLLQKDRLRGEEVS